MVADALRGLFARKLRTVLTALRRRARRRVRRRAHTSSPTRSTRRSTELFERRRGHRRRHHAPSSRSRATSAAASSRFRPGPQKVQAVAGVDAAERGSSAGRRSSTKDGERVGGNGAADDPLPRNGRALRPATTTSRARTRRRPDEIDARQGDRRQGRLQASATPSRSPAAARARYRSSASRSSATRTSLGIGTLVDAARRGAGDRGHSRARSTESSSPPRAGRHARAAQGADRAALGGTADVRTGEEQADRRPATSTTRSASSTTALLVFAGIAVFVGGFLIFNTFSVTVAQRIARVRAAADARRVAPAGAALRGRRDARDRLLASVLGIIGGLLLAPGLRGCWRSFGVELPVDGHGDRAAHDHRRPRWSA